METVQVLTGQEHVLLRPETYVGSVESEELEDFIVTKDFHLEYATTMISPALVKVVDELLTNAADHRCRHLEEGSTIKQRCTTIKVEFHLEEGRIRVWNDGDGIEVRKHGEYTESYIPELIFGRLMCGTNFDDSHKRIGGGRNGYGAKLANIFSKSFVVETVDAQRKLKYVQEYSQNMTVTEIPEITKLKAKQIKPYTCIDFWPDLPRFGLETLNEDVLAVLRKRVFDLAATGPCGSKVFVDNRKVPVDGLQKYMKLHLPNGEKIVFEAVNERWKVGVAFTPASGFKTVTFVNSIATTRGGTHVEYIVGQIITHIQLAVLKRLPENRPTPTMIREHLTLFIDCLVENPSFDSQRKEELKTKVKDFGSTCKLSKEFLEKIVKTGIVKYLVDVITGKAKAELLKSTDGKKTTRLRGIPKLEDAEYAGTSKSESCILVLSEGDSAKASCISGVSSLPTEMRKCFGVFPLRGKLLNVREASMNKLENNSEIANIKKILGLQQGKVYHDIKDLRYGKVMIMTDQDVDGSHIKGLLLNCFHVFWPQLIDNNYVCCLATPIVKAFPKQQSESILDFYSQADFESWRTTVDISKYRCKHYKGLGTSTRDESKEYFKDIFKKLIVYHNNDGGADVSIPLAFEKSKADARKEWLLAYDSKKTLHTSQKEVSVSEFVHSELIHFSADDVKRSIPSLVDGLTPSRRKVIWTTFKKGLTNQNKEIRVSQLAGAVSELSAYKHGEVSLQQTIVRLAQDYVGSNNINLLVPSGQFGTRLLNGADSASPRYILTYLQKITSHIFRSEDDGVLEYVEDDGLVVEPKVYFPVIPLVLVNGTEGIGTGWSSFVPPHNPKDIITNIRNRLTNPSVEFQPMIPWYKGFKGSVIPIENGNFLIKGLYTISGNKVHITELPIGQWTSVYKEKVLDPLVESKIIDRLSENLSDIFIDFTLYFRNVNDLVTMVENNTLEKTLRLSDTIHISNMHLYPPEKEYVRKFVSATDILEEYYVFRLQKYSSRKDYLLKVKAYERDILKWKVQFITDKMSGKILLEKRTYNEVIQDLENFQYPMFGSTWDDPNKSYKYITSTNVFAFTVDRRNQLEEEYQKKLREFVDLESTSPENMWLDDLNKIEELLE